jgi:hypothetical protein
VLQIGLEITWQSSSPRTYTAIRNWYDLAHEWIVNGFTDLTSPEAVNDGATMGAFANKVTDESEFPQHGISMVKFPTRVIFEQELQLQLSEAPRWKPRIVIDDFLR